MADKQPVPCTMCGERTCEIALRVILFHTSGDESLYSVETQYIGLPVMARSKSSTCYTPLHDQQKQTTEKHYPTATRTQGRHGACLVVLVVVLVINRGVPGHVHVHIHAHRAPPVPKLSPDAAFLLSVNLACLLQ